MASDNCFTMYLVQRDANAHGADGRPLFIALVGRIVSTPAGCRFLPNTSAHKASRKIHSDIFRAIPRWASELADRRGFADLLTCAELSDAMAASGHLRKLAPEAV